MKLRAGDWVEVRSKEEILRSLDGNGRLEGLPFMPQMFEYCGRQFRVYKRAHKTCDTVNQTGGRWLTNAVHLELRCDGKAYGGCQAACLIFWKEVWLKPVDGGSKSADDAPHGEIARANGTGCSEVDVWKATRSQDHESTGETIYCCQATQLPHFTTHAPWWDPRQYIEDYTSRNIKFDQMVRILAYAVYYPFCRPSRGKLEWLGNFFRGLYDQFQAIRGGVPFPRRRGTLPAGQSAPMSTLNLKPGEMVRVKAYKEILATVSSSNMNRGLFFDAEMVPYCGGVYRVRAKVTNFIDEKTGKSVSLKTPAVILENVWCRSCYSNCRFFCPRSIYSWWREAWLERVFEGDYRRDDCDEPPAESRRPILPPEAGAAG